jgi:hypothetical protein
MKELKSLDAKFPNGTKVKNIISNQNFEVYMTWQLSPTVSIVGCTDAAGKLHKFEEKYLTRVLG